MADEAMKESAAERYAHWAYWRDRAQTAEARLAQTQDGLRKILKVAENASPSYANLGIASIARTTLGEENA